MKLIQEFLNEIGLNITIMVGGVIGGIIGRKKDRPMWEQIFSVFTSAFIANYTAPLIIELFGLSTNTIGGVGFISGYMGKHMLDYLFEKFKKKVDEKIEE